MNTNSEQLVSLKNLIYQTLDPLINSDYCLLDIPDHKNIGDNLIWAGELEYLSRLKYKMQYTCNMFLFDKNQVKENHTILLHGGGNFGDVWRANQEFRTEIVKEFPKNKIIILPQTIHYSDKNYLDVDAKVFNSHNDLTICVRDTKSFEIAKTAFKNNDIKLLPDMAFCLDYTDHIDNEQKDKILLLKRMDRELKENTLFKNLHKKLISNNNVELKDWPTYNLSSFGTFTERIYNFSEKKISQTLSKSSSLSYIVDPRYGLKRKDNCERYIETGINFINQYDEIYSTRLHVYILSILLDKKVYMLDNIYGKNSSFFNTWMKEFKNSELLT